MYKNFQEKQYLLGWLKEITNLEIISIEQLGNGIAYCFLFHDYYPTTFQITNIRKKTNTIQDRLWNLMIFQKAVRKQKITHLKINIDLLSKNIFSANFSLIKALYNLFNKQKKEIYENVGAVKHQNFSSYQKCKNFTQCKETSICKQISSHEVKNYNQKQLLFEKNCYKLLDRIKEILLQPSNSSEKIIQLKILLNLQTLVVKREENHDYLDKDF